MPASDCLVCFYIRELVEQQQVADQEEGNEGNQHNCPGNMPGEDEECTPQPSVYQNQNREQAGTGRGSCLKPGVYRNNDQQSDRTDEQDRPTDNDGKVRYQWHAAMAAVTMAVPSTIGALAGSWTRVPLPPLNGVRVVRKSSPTFDIFIFVDRVYAAVRCQRANK